MELNNSKWGVNLMKITERNYSREEMKALRDFIDYVLSSKEFDNDTAFDLYEGYRFISSTSMVPIENIDE